ncbi:MobF family relaxase [Pseudonocardia sediminis]|uniref:MobF family relaxase n=1 Tax=Pseudonocardia sediminis TaxID=1397368 RepID=UPI0013EEF919|nr:MobF family relaxase [Pseudonocardia sediminis]
MGVVRVTAIGPGSVEYLLHGCDSHPEKTPAQDLDSPEQGSARGSEAAHEHAHEVGVDRAGGAGYMAAAVAAGEPAGVWFGAGMEALGLSMRAGEGAREEDVRAIFGQLRYPDQELEGSSEKTPIYLGSKPRKYQTAAQKVAAALKKEPDAPAERRAEIEASASRTARSSTAYYDVTFSPVKSVSVYYTALLAAGDTEGAERVRRAHDEAIRIAVRSVENDVAWVRTGRHGAAGPSGRAVGEWEKATGLSVVIFAHHTNRDGEPQLHAHGAVLNRAATADGRVYALDGAGFRPVKDALSTAYTRAYQQLLTESDGVLFETRGDGVAREIVGIDPALMAEASTRTHERVRPRVAELTEAYIDRHGREPGTRARRAIAEQAVKETRAPKTGLAGPAAVAQWADKDPGRRARLAASLDAVDAAVVAAVADGRHPAAEQDIAGGAVAMSGHEAALAVLAVMAAGQAVTGQDPGLAAAESGGPVTLAGRVGAAVTAGVADVQAQYATWTVGNLTAAIDHHLGDHAASLGVAADERPAFLATLTRAVLEPGSGFGVVQASAGDPVPVPDALRRLDTDGRSRFRAHIDERYVTTEHLGAEERLVATFDTDGAVRVGDEVAAAAAERLSVVGLSGDQVAAVVGVLSSGRVGDVLVGPAGTGKSHTIGALAREWNAGIGGRVVGVATATIAARNLAGLGLEAMNTAQFLAAFTPDPDTGQARDRLGAGDLLVVDEAGMSGTPELARLVEMAAAAGAKILAAGDPEQLHEVGAGGMFSYLAARPATFELATVHRFVEEWEAEASLLLRAGDTAAVAAYDDHGRLRAGTLEQMQEAAVRGHLADTLDGKQALLVVGTNATAAELSKHIHGELVRVGRVAPEILVELPDETRIGVGDVIQARHNDYRLRVDAAPDGSRLPVTNRELYTVIGRDRDGQLLARDPRGAVAHLPDDYVEQHVTLAYAVTAHAAQGLTVDVSRGLLDRDATRESVYVPGSRGREMNLLYMVTERAPDHHDPRRIDDTAAQRLADILGQRSGQDAALLVRELGQAEESSLSTIGELFNQVSAEAGHAHHAEILAELLGEARAAQLSEEGAYGRLLGVVRGAELAGHDPRALLTEAVEMRDFGGARSLSQVLHWRVESRVAARVAEHTAQTTEPSVGTPEWDWVGQVADLPEGPVRDYLTALGELGQDRQDELGRATALEPPVWAQKLLPQVPDAETEPEQRAEWEQRAGVVAAFREYRGIPETQISIGEAPPQAQQFTRAWWLAAAAQLDDDPATAAWRGRADAELYQAREIWTHALQRAEDYGPRTVAEELSVTHRLAADLREDATIEAARLANIPTNDPDHADLAATVQRYQQLAEHYTAEAAELDTAHAARQQWWADTEPLRAADHAAAVELARRGLPEHRDTSPPQPAAEQLTLLPLTTDTQPDQAQTTDHSDDQVDVVGPAASQAPAVTAAHDTEPLTNADTETAIDEATVINEPDRAETGQSAPEQPGPVDEPENNPVTQDPPEPTDVEASADVEAAEESGRPQEVNGGDDPGWSTAQTAAENAQAATARMRDNARAQELDRARQAPAAQQAAEAREEQTAYAGRAHDDQLQTEAERRGPEAGRGIELENPEQDLEYGYDEDD